MSVCICVECGRWCAEGDGALADNSIGAEGAQHLGKGLETNKARTTLDPTWKCVCNHSDVCGREGKQGKRGRNVGGSMECCGTRGMVKHICSTVL